MSNVYFISDLHFGHEKIMGFSGDLRQGDTWLENIHVTVALWNARITKRDTVYVLGDIAMSPEGLEVFGELLGTKYLIRGNHDEYALGDYLKYFKDIFGIKRYKGYWLTHAPVHPTELRGRKNIHGHVHGNTITNHYGEPDDRYVNVCLENSDGGPVKFKDIDSGERCWNPNMPYYKREE